MMTYPMRLGLCFAQSLLWLAFCGAVGADPPSEIETETAEADAFDPTPVQQIFQRRCSTCHGPASREGGLRITSRNDFLQRNDSGAPAVVAGEPAASELLRRVRAEPGERMPPDGEPLSDQEITLLEHWIAAGLPWSDAPQKPHWAYVAPQRPEVPAAGIGWARTPIDHFIVRQIEQQAPGLGPAPLAEPEKLLRRVYLDLIGLPPSPEEVHAFTADPSPAHYERIVNELLASPHYGEKWARGWLDLARYADSNGFQADQFREIWPYRDWVIQAMNEDLPFDEFTIAQIAGDLLPEMRTDAHVATGFHRCTTCNVEAGVDPEENRVNQVIDRVNTTGTVWLGTTLECAQCHNHKYDPFTQEEYYRLFAFFNNTPLEVELPSGEGVQYEMAGPRMELPLPDAEQARRRRLESQQAELQHALADRRSKLDLEFDTWLAEMRTQTDSLPRWHPLEISEFHSSAGCQVERQEDGSLLVVGEVPDQVTYTLTVETTLDDITGFRLEALSDDRLPGRGPGRGSGERPNFVLAEFEVSVLSPDDASPRTVLLTRPQASFSQQNWDVSGLVDGNLRTGWAINPRFGESHWASFQTAEPLSGGEGLKLQFRLPQIFGAGRVIGRLRLSAMTGSPEWEDLPETLVMTLQRDGSALAQEERQTLAEWQTSHDAETIRLQGELRQIEQELTSIRPPTTLVMVEMEQSRTTSIFRRGDFLQPGAEVQPGTPAVLPPLTSSRGSASFDRLDLAYWLVSRNNPLTARVAVNRWWAEFFGQGIVTTLEDFGTQGEPPTHPELLDWLAVEFMEQGWSMKHIHKLIVLSATYQQDSRLSPDAIQRDPLNLFYARGPRWRMPAEMIRDHALAVSGLLSPDLGGPPIYPPQPEGIWRHVGRNAPRYETNTDANRFRRGIYVVWRRSAPYPSFVTFDAPDRGTCVVQRSRTNTPLQALVLLNDPAYVEMAFGLARRLMKFEGSDAEKITRGFQLCLSRAPTSIELEHLLGVLEEERLQLEESEAKAADLVPEASRLAGVPLCVQGAWFTISNILLNLDETITRG